ncbi:MAG: hypothetical protein KatS3mg105_2724 [Gemmatales bacterium]|nr:MAG: hypothetical protein KatS3mg105_2724 [Gemmatales bacterium]
MPWLRSGLVVVFLASTGLAGDWPQWLGPHRDGSTSEKIRVWQKAPTRLWTASVGEGHSSPIVADGKVFLLYKVKGQTREELAAFDADKGTRLWATSYETNEFKSIFGNGPRGTPAFDTGKVYSLGVTGVLTCFDAKTGKISWQVDTLKTFKAPNLVFGISCSPLVDGDKVFVSVGKGTSIVAFDKRTGKVLWKSLSDAASYASPIVFGKGKERQLVFLTQQGVVSLAPDSGALFWKYRLVDLLSESSTTPVQVGNRLFASSVTFGGVGLELSIKDDKPQVKEAWKNKSLNCYFSTPVAVGDHLFMVTGKIFPPPPEVSLRCVDFKTGKILWTKAKVGKYHASLIRMGDKRLLLLDDAGNLILLDANLKAYKELARSSICGPTWAHPAIASGRLFIRDQKELICLKLP